MLHDKQGEINGIFRTILTTVEDYNDDDADNDSNNSEDDLSSVPYFKKTLSDYSIA